MTVAPAFIDGLIEYLARPVADWMTAIVFFSVPAFGADWPLVVVWLVLGGLFCTVVYLGVNLWGLPIGLHVVTGAFDEEGAPGEVSHFQALATALSGTVGIGNIGGVAVAVATGGPGATFWMVVAGMLGMATKFAEVTLGVRYRRENEDGTVSGGPMYYLDAGLKEMGLGGLGKVLGVFYAVGIVIGCLGIGNMFQSNQAAVQLQTITGGVRDGYLSSFGWLIGLILAIVVGLVILGGIKTIASVTDKLVPFMGILYFVGAVTIIGLNYEAIPEAIWVILEGAFTWEGAAGGAVGAMVIGFQRAVFSNEAGIGSASIAHSAVRTNKPASEGLVATLEPLVDTIIICSLTALVITTTSVMDADFLAQDLEGVALTSDAFTKRVWGSEYALAVAAILFAISTMIAWAYYGLKGWTYLLGEATTVKNVYKVIFCVFIVVGAAIELDAVLDISDALVFLLCIPNILGVAILTPVVWRELRGFLGTVRERWFGTASAG